MNLKKPSILIAALVLLAGAGAAYWAWVKPASPKTTYKKITVEKGHLEVTILSTGTVQPENRVEIKPPIAGRIEKVMVAEGQRVKKGQILAWMSSTERAALLDAATAKGPEELKRWEELYRSTPILAPLDGTIILRKVESGQTLTNADAIFDMSDRLTVKAQVDETDISHIKLKQSASIVLDAYSTEPIAAHVDQIAYDATAVNNVTTYLVDVLPDKTPAFMRSGMTANVKFSLDSKSDALIIPVEAVRIRDGEAYVMIPGADSEQISERAIETGLSDGKRLEVISGLSEGEQVLAPEFRSAAAAPKRPSNPLSPFGSGRRH